MRYLLDSHVLLWALTDPAKLGRGAHRVLSDRSSIVMVSAVTAWEIATNQRLGKLPQADALVGAYSHHLDRLGAVRLPVTEEHALLAGRLDWSHRDPFDRMLAAQAIIEALVLVTADDAFEGLRGLSLLW